MAFRGSKPKLLCSERSSPRTATIEEVISTAQMAICATSNRSRPVIRRPSLLVDPDFRQLIWIGAEYLPDWDRAEEEPARQRQQQSDCIHMSVWGHRHTDGGRSQGATD